MQPAQPPDTIDTNTQTRQALKLAHDIINRGHRMNFTTADLEHPDLVGIVGATYQCIVAMRKTARSSLAKYAAHGPHDMYDASLRLQKD